jgi:hypothetical protein
MGSSRVQVASREENAGVTKTRVLVAQGAAGTTLLASAVLGRKHKIAAYSLAIIADGTVKFAGSVSGDLMGAQPWAARGGSNVANGLEDLIQTGLNEDLNLVSTGGAVSGVVLVVTEA